MNVQLKILGPIDVLVEGTSSAPAGIKPKQLLAALMLDPNSVMPTDRLVSALWPEERPASALENLRTYATAIRHSLRSTGNAGISLTTIRLGYRLNVPPHLLDLSQFEELTARARAATASGRLSDAASSLGEALQLWTGAAGEGLPRSGWLGSALDSLDESRTIALEERADAWLGLGRYAELIPELLRLTAEHPLRERLWQQLMLAQYCSGAAGEALETYARARRTLVDQLGIEPGDELVELQRSILRRDLPAASALADQTSVGPPADAASGRYGTPPDHARGRQSAGRPAADEGSRPIPLQVPAPPVPFVGREKEERLLREAMTAADTDAPMVALIRGPLGTGKSALASRVAHGLRDAFPDGQLYVNLRECGSPHTSTTTLHAVRHLLRSLGRDVPSDATLSEATCLLRSVLASHRLLIVIDNAVCESSVVALLPAYPGSSAIVTSSREFALTQAGRQTRLGPLDDADGLRLLGSLVDPAVIRADQRAAAEIVRLCGGIPLVLRAAAARLASRPNWSVAMLRDSLKDGCGRLEGLRLGESSLREYLRSALDELAAEQPAAIELLSRLALFPTRFRQSDIAHLFRPGGSRSTLQIGPSELETLIDFHLLETPAPGYFDLPDLVRVFASDLSKHKVS
ncbi:BTAD domain-containing putative transcriptional regulator [Micromonospora sp. NPDC005686]|uniref:AfsR/SARP family transcriptional regulator n=1 Tax=unclassified Micromonospora TaxID=2617518 RepID=UPI0033B15D66